METIEQLKHATKLPFCDHVRTFEIASNLSVTRQILVCLTEFLRCIARLSRALAKRNAKTSVSLDYSQYDCVLVNDHHGHCDLFMRGIIRSCSASTNVLYLSLDDKITNSDPRVTVKINDLKSFTFKSLFSAFRFCLSEYPKLSSSIFWNFVVYLSCTVSTARAIEAANFYRTARFKEGAILITLCDAHWHQSVITTQFKRLNKPTFTLIHGLPSEWNLICPFISDFVLTWGPSMTKKALEYCSSLTLDRIFEIGNTKYQTNLAKRKSDEFSISQIEEIVFLSPGYDSYVPYGLDGLESDITEFLELDLKNYSLAIRPRPNPIEQKFVKKLLATKHRLKKVNLLEKSDISQMVSSNRLFIGSISSAISDIIILNGLFIGVNNRMPMHVLKTMITYSPEIYFPMRELKPFIETLNEDKNLIEFRNNLKLIRKNLTTVTPNNLDLRLRKLALNKPI